MKTAAIVQARIGSTRLPGKVLLDLAGKPVLRHVLERCRAIDNVDVVVCAVPDEPASAPLEVVGEQCGATVFRGPEQDVLGRYLGAARSVNADIVLRVTSDCPLIDPDICADVIALRMRAAADYACNNMPPSFPHGLDCEAFTMDSLELAARKATMPNDREHVTPYLRRDDRVRRVNLKADNPEYVVCRWTLDYPEDMSFFRALANEFADLTTARMKDILTVLGRKPDILRINSGLRVR
jgi:glutamate-1-semialdehyde 2,1-aminomutase/spore coat polysaccharide biosynthesis protein SpsF